MVRQATAGIALGGAARIIQQIYEHLSDVWHIDYRKDPPLNSRQTQRVRLAGDVLWNSAGRMGEGTCIDLALLIAGGLEGLRQSPLLAVVDLGASWHALVGCWKRSRRRLDVLPQDVEALIEDAFWVDPNGCTQDPLQSCDFERAGQRALDMLASQPLVFALDVTAARSSSILSLPLRPEDRKRRRTSR
jgi:hypothetical protein